MIEVVKQCDGSRVVAWLNEKIRPLLSRDVSNYAKGRLRTWLGTEPTLTSPTRLLKGSPIPDSHLQRLRDLVGWQFAYCLVTYSGDDSIGIGIDPHRDASYADYEAWGWSLSGQCQFRYWEGRQSFGYSPELVKYTANDPPTHEIVIEAGDIVRFNCKNLHSANPSPGRWNLNFWRAKQ